MQICIMFGTIQEKKLWAVTTSIYKHILLGIIWQIMHEIFFKLVGVCVCRIVHRGFQPHSSICTSHTFFFIDFLRKLFVKFHYNLRYQQNSFLLLDVNLRDGSNNRTEVALYITGCSNVQLNLSIICIRRKCPCVKYNVKKKIYLIKIYL